jgi:glucose/arabinose dehydrogenase
MARPTRRVAGLLVAIALLAGCATAAASAPDWRPQPSFNGEGGPRVQLPTPNAGPGPSQPAPSPGEPNPSASPSGADSAVVAKNLVTPTGLAVLPDGTALVGERITGRILRVQPKPEQPVQAVRTLTGLDTSGDGGLLDLALSPTFGEDNLVYAYITTPTGNEVVDFTLAGPVTPVVTGIPRGQHGNIGRILFDAAGNLYVGTGDAGQPALAAAPTSLAGKVLRVDPIGAPAAGNPRVGSAVYTQGHHEVDGLCQDPAGGRVYEVERGANGASDEVNALSAGGSYGWPVAAANTRQAITTLPSSKSGAGDCAIMGGQLYVTSLDGTALLSAPLTAAGTIGGFAATLDGTYGRLLTVVAAPDGALWLTTANLDGHGRPGPDDERVLRITPSGAGGVGSVL